MTIENFVIKEISKEEQSAINTASAMQAVVADHYNRRVIPKLEALHVAFKGYTGTWRETFTVPGTEVKIEFCWDGSQMVVNRVGHMFQLTIVGSHTNPELEMAVALLVEKIAMAWTVYLDSLYTKGPYQK